MPFTPDCKGFYTLQSGFFVMSEIVRLRMRTTNIKTEDFSMKKKMIYKLDETQNIIVEVETEEQERQI